MSPTILTPTSVHIGTADVYSFRFTETFGWAIFTINNATGEFGIQSDWGSWSHRWPVQHLGEKHSQHPKPLTHFLAVDTGSHYIVDKLSYNKTPDLDRVFSEKETLRKIRSEICAKRREDFYLLSSGLTRDRARNAWNQLKEWLEEHVFLSPAGVQQALDDLYSDRYKDLLFVIGPDSLYIYEDTFQFRPSPAYTFLIDTLIPFFQSYLRTAVLNIPERRSA